MEGYEIKGEVSCSRSGSRAAGPKDAVYEPPSTARTGASPRRRSAIEPCETMRNIGLLSLIFLGASLLAVFITSIRSWGRRPEVVEELHRD